MDNIKIHTEKDERMDGFEKIKAVFLVLSSFLTKT